MPENPLLLKGVTVHHALEGARARLGAAAFEGLLAGLAPEHRTALEPPILATSWYPLDAFVAFLEADLLLEDGGLTHNFAARAEKLAELHFTTLYPQYSRLGSPEELLRRIPAGHRLYYLGIDLEVVRAGAGQAVIRYRGFSARHRLLEISTEALYRKALELVGVRSPTARFTARMADGADAELTLGWK